MYPVTQQVVMSRFTAAADDDDFHLELKQFNQQNKNLQLIW